MAMNMSIAERLDKVAPDVKDIIEKSKCDDACMVSLRDASRDVLLANGLAYVSKFAPDFVVPHPKNRGGAILEAAEVPRKLTAFFSKGFSLLETKRAAGVERNPGPQGDDDEAKAIKLAEMSNGQIAPIAKGSAKIFGTACSHTNQAVRLGLHGMPHSDPRFTTNGKISRAKLAEKQPGLEIAMDSGLDFFVIRWQVADRWAFVLNHLQN